MKKILLILFIVVSTGELFSQLSELHRLNLVLKPLIMTLLVAYYIVASESKVSKLVLAAMILSFLGDTFLLLEGELYFMLGLGSFLLAHLFYTRAYRQHRNDNESELQGIRRIRYSFPIVLCGTGLLVILYPHLGKLLIPVFMYALVLVVMVLNALFRVGRTSPASFWMVFTGACLFMISDSLLAINKFISPLVNGGFWIMLTYIVAQFLIVDGLTRHQH